MVAEDGEKVKEKDERKGVDEEVHGGWPAFVGKKEANIQQDVAPSVPQSSNYVIAINGIMVLPGSSGS